MFIPIKPRYRDAFEDEILGNIRRRHGLAYNDDDLEKECLYYATDMSIEFYDKSGGLLPKDWQDHIFNEVCAVFDKHFAGKYNKIICKTQYSAMISDLHFARNLVNKYYNRPNDEIEFDIDKFTYSLEVASSIYKELTTQEKANNKFYEQLELFLQKKRIKYECLNHRNGDITYKSDEQTIYVSVELNNEPSVIGIMLPTNGIYTKQLFKEGIANKCLFGLPIFTMEWFDDIEKAFIHFINRESYLQYDTPEGRRTKELLGF